MLLCSCIHAASFFLSCVVVPAPLAIPSLLYLPHPPHALTFSCDRVSNVNWHSVPLPKPAVQLWNTIAQELCNHDKKLVRRLKQTRKQHLNDTKKERNEAWRISHSDRHVAEAKLYEDYEDFYHLNKVNCCILLVFCYFHVAFTLLYYFRITAS